MDYKYALLLLMDRNKVQMRFTSNPAGKPYDNMELLVYKFRNKQC